MKKLFSILLLGSLLLNQVAIAQTINPLKPEQNQIADSTIEFQINDTHFLHKLLAKSPLKEKTALDKFLSINDNQIQGYYSENHQTLKIQSKPDNFKQILKFLESKNLKFTESNCPTVEEENCLLSSTQKVKDYTISFNDNAIYLHKNSLSDKMLMQSFNLEPKTMLKAQIQSETDPLVFEIQNIDSNFDFNYSINLSNPKLREYLQAKNTNFNLKDYISENTIAFLEGKGLNKDTQEKLARIEKTKFLEFCTILKQDCKEVESYIDLSQNIYNLPENSILYELLIEQDSAVLMDINQDFEISYAYIFKDSKDFRSQITPELDQNLANLYFKKSKTTNGDIYKIQGSINDIFKAFAGQERAELVTPESNSIIKLLPNNQDQETQISYIKLIESNQDLIVTFSSDYEYELTKNQNLNPKTQTGLNYYEFNINPYLKVANQNPEALDSFFVAIFGNFFKDIQITGLSEIKDSNLSSQNTLSIPSETLDMLLEFLGNTEKTSLPISYLDMQEEQWYYQDVDQLEKVVDYDYIFDGTMNYDTFQIKLEPDKEITRKEFIMMIIDLLYRKEVSNFAESKRKSVIYSREFFADFSDTQALGFYEMMYAKQIGIVKGDEGLNTLRPNDSLSRAEAITILARSFESLKNTQAEDLELNFQDVPQDAWYLSNLKKAVKNKVVKGTSPTTFSPTDKLNRAQAITLINRLNNQILNLY